MPRSALPSLDLLVGFEAAARHLSFTKAGEELFLTQSAVSRQIKELEDQLGVALFHRRHRALVLTEAGQQFYATAAQVITTMRTATERLRAQSGRKRPLSLTVSIEQIDDQQAGRSNQGARESADEARHRWHLRILRWLRHQGRHGHSSQ